MKTILIAHKDSEFDLKIIAPWLSSFSELVGIVILDESSEILKKRAKNELKRSGFFGFLDVIAFRIFYKLIYQKKDKNFINNLINEFNYHIDLKKYNTILSESVNSEDVRKFIYKFSPDIVLARSKQLIKKDIFTIPFKGTFVLHPGITPKYRNAYGLFWAIYEKDFNNVGTSLLKIDEGIDTGPIYEYYRHNYNLHKETINIMQINSVFLNLDKVKNKFEEIYIGIANPIKPKLEKGKLYGQIKLSKYLKTKLRK